MTDGLLHARTRRTTTPFQRFLLYILVVIIIIIRRQFVDLFSTIYTKSILKIKSTDDRGRRLCCRTILLLTQVTGQRE